MLEMIKYRVPGEKIVEQNGTFILSDNKVNPSGFILSDFQMNSVYQFVPSAIPLKKKHVFFFQRKTPVVLSIDNYLLRAHYLLQMMKISAVSKVVFSRIKKVSFDEKKTDDFFEALEKEYPNAFVYLVSSKIFGTWVGATPETLVSLEGKSAFTIALAGTKKITDVSPWGTKEKEEQDFVSQFILTNLTKKKYDTLQINGPREIAAGPVKHLRTDISFSLEQKYFFSTVKLLHPTPAVSGFPQRKALDLIAKFEPQNRELYAGIIGVISKEKSKLFVNLRCCQLKRGAAYLYLGGGFTKDSIPEMEWEETENKSKTLLNILQKI
jgi:isochorismate synthase